MSEYIKGHREYLIRFMKKHGLNPNSWAKKADISESTLRAYLLGRSNSIGLEILYKMANGISVSVSSLIESAENSLDEVHFDKAVIEIDDIIAQKNLEMSSAEKAKLYLAWYKILHSADTVNLDLNGLLNDILKLTRLSSKGVNIN